MNEIKVSFELSKTDYGLNCACIRGGVYNPILNGITDEDGKYILRVDDEVGTILVKDSVMGNPTPNIELRFMVACSSLETTVAEPQPRTLSTISFQLMENENFNTDVGTVSFVSDTGPVSEVTVLVISKSAPVPDAQSSIQIAQADERVQSWSSGLREVSANADVRQGKWRVYFQGTEDCPEQTGESTDSGDVRTTPSNYGSASGGCSAGIVTVYVDPATKEVFGYEESTP